MGQEGVTWGFVAAARCCCRVRPGRHQMRMSAAAARTSCAACPVEKCPLPLFCQHSQNLLELHQHQQGPLKLLLCALPALVPGPCPSFRFCRLIIFWDHLSLCQPLHPLGYQRRSMHRCLPRSWPHHPEHQHHLCLEGLPRLAGQQCQMLL